MKTILSLLILFSVIALPALGELTDADLNKIRLIVQEEIQPIKADIATLKVATTSASCPDVSVPSPSAF